MGGKIYKVGYTLIEFILQNFGSDKFPELIANYGNLAKVFNQTEEQFTKEWYEFVKAKYL